MNRKALLMSGGGILAMVALWYVMLFSPQSSALSQANQRADAARQHQTELRAQIRALTLAKKSSSAVEAQIATFKQLIPNTPQLAAFIDAADGAAAASGINLTAIAPTQASVTKGATVQELHLTLAITGTYFQVIDFINRLDALPRLVVVDGLSLSSDKAAGTLNAQLNARMFMQADPVRSSSGGK